MREGGHARALCVREGLGSSVQFSAIDGTYVVRGAGERRRAYLFIVRLVEGLHGVLRHLLDDASLHHLCGHLLHGVLDLGDLHELIHRGHDLSALLHLTRERLLAHLIRDLHGDRVHVSLGRVELRDRLARANNLLGKQLHSEEVRVRLGSVSVRPLRAPVWAV